MNTTKRREFATLISALGLWMVATAITFGTQGTKIFCSDLISGVLLILLALTSLFRKETWNVWIACLVGMWIQFAPVALWTTQTWHYLNGTLCGFLAMAISLRMLTPSPFTHQPDLAPRGWSYNPSGWNFRVPLVFSALICSFLSRYLAAFQLGLIPSVIDPFFGDGTYRVITSTISQSFPISDAGLGAFAYMLEALMGCEGDVQRWRSRPWVVLVFGILVVPVSLVSIILIVLQPLAVGAWCGWCLITALIMILMIPLGIGEFAAGLYFVYEGLKKKRPLIHLLLHGEKAGGKVVTADFHRPKRKFSLPGVTIPWNLVLSALLGLWVIFSLQIFPMPLSIANGDYIAGPLLFAFSIFAMAEVIRALRFVNLLFALWLILSPWFLGEVTGLALVNHCLVGVAVLLLSLRKGPVHQRYGALDKFII